ncbi:putative membrane protein [Algoriphagus boseongensis]|uniref:Putative membrane protein n=1 Tax=Algoriphagus boseongensis TaxID=1442587 RepID=A0A4R6T3W0_9BACT|nr:heparan-alpha-glucosaminide N-acetyltransferase domain-containing protein [Algoriphagus boseongensis]TDQ16422.1 putative membrane protein [Algoriphagus boseongensis]
MNKIQTSRIESIDLLRGVVMVIMALDHVRDYFFYQSFYGDPTDLETTTPILFFTRFITHFCAPAFVFLAGTSAFLYGRNKSKPELSKFLLTRGIWLVFLEVALNSLIWTFDLTYSLVLVQVIWAIGASMICLSFLIYLPKTIILILGSVLIAGHNLLDGISAEGSSLSSILWYILHQDQLVVFNPSQAIYFHYPLIPWIGLMALGYLFGGFYSKDFDPEKRKKWLLRIGFGAITLFVVLRGINVYGDLHPWSVYETGTKTFLSFINVTKYPPSLLYVCITLGPAFLFLYFIEGVKNKITDFFLVFGRVPLFYYFAHMLLIHGLSLIAIELGGGDWQDLIITAEGFLSLKLMDYGFSLGVVYLVWIGVVAILYFPCRWYMNYKAKHKEMWWLSYL